MAVKPKNTQKKLRFVFTRAKTTETSYVACNANPLVVFFHYVIFLTPPEQSLRRIKRANCEGYCATNFRNLALMFTTSIFTFYLCIPTTNFIFIYKIITLYENCIILEFQNFRIQDFL